MKTNLIISIILIAIITGFGSCKKSKDDPAKSKACDITSFKVGSDAWQISGANISYLYPKGTTQGNLTPVITVSEKAKVSPESGVAQNFFTDGGVTYTVTAEDGTTKTYTAKATVNASK